MEVFKMVVFVVSWWWWACTGTIATLCAIHNMAVTSQAAWCTRGAYSTSTVAIAEASIFCLKEDSHVVQQFTILILELNYIQTIQFGIAELTAKGYTGQGSVMYTLAECKYPTFTLVYFSNGIDRVHVEGEVGSLLGIQGDHIWWNKINTCRTLYHEHLWWKNSHFPYWLRVYIASSFMPGRRQ